MKCCVPTDVGTWTNRLTFEPDPDYSPDAGTGLLSPISYALQRGILLRRENLTYEYWPDRSLQRGVVLKWFYSPRAVGTPLSEARALQRVPSILFDFVGVSRVQFLFGNDSVVSSQVHSVCLINQLLFFPFVCAAAKNRIDNCQFRPSLANSSSKHDDKRLRCADSTRQRSDIIPAAHGCLLHVDRGFDPARGIIYGPNYVRVRSPHCPQISSHQNPTHATPCSRV